MQYVIIASLLFGFSPTVSKILMEHGIPAQRIMFLNCFISFVLAYILLRRKKYTLRISRNLTFKLLILGVLGQAMTSLLLLNSYRYIAVGIATFLHFLYPAIVCFGTIFLFRETLTISKAVCLFFAIAGIYYISAGITSVNLPGIFFAITSSFSYAFYLMLADKWIDPSIPSLIRMFYSSAGALIILFPFQFSSVDFPVLKNSPGLLIVMLLVGISSFTAYLCINLSVIKLGATTTAFANLLEPVTSLAMSVIVLHTIISPRQIVGIVIIGITVIYAVMQQTKHS